MQLVAHKGITLQANVAYSFLYVIVGLHAVHVARWSDRADRDVVESIRQQCKNYSVVPVEVMSTYWHLWMCFGFICWYSCY